MIEYSFSPRCSCPFNPLNRRAWFDYGFDLLWQTRVLCVCVEEFERSRRHKQKSDDEIWFKWASPSPLTSIASNISSLAPKLPKSARKAMSSSICTLKTRNRMRFTPSPFHLLVSNKIWRITIITSYIWWSSVETIDPCCPSCQSGTKSLSELNLSVTSWSILQPKSAKTSKELYMHVLRTNALFWWISQEGCSEYLRITTIANELHILTIMNYGCRFPRLHFYHLLSANSDVSDWQKQHLWPPIDAWVLNHMDLLHLHVITAYEKDRIERNKQCFLTCWCNLNVESSPLSFLHKYLPTSTLLNAPLPSTSATWKILGEDLQGKVTRKLPFYSAECLQ